MSHSAEKNWPLWLRYICCYLLWIGLGALGFWLVLQLRINLIDIYAYFQFDRWSFAAVHNFAFVILAMLWLGYVLLIEEYLRQGAERGQLLSRAVGIFLVVLTLLAMSYVLQFLIVYS